MYLLISVYERDIITKRFDRYDDAFKQMQEELATQVKKWFCEEELDAALNKIAQGYVTDDDLFGIGTTWAWSSCDNDWDYDWKIVEV